MKSCKVSRRYLRISLGMVSGPGALPLNTFVRWWSKVYWVAYGFGVILVVYGSGLREFCHGGSGIYSVVLQECSFPKGVWRITRIWIGSAFTLFGAWVSNGS